MPAFDATAAWIAEWNPGTETLDTIGMRGLKAEVSGRMPHSNRDSRTVTAEVARTGEPRFLGVGSREEWMSMYPDSADFVSEQGFGMLAELTYRCPLGCAYCSNPLNMADYSDELVTEEWRRVLVEARDLGVLQCHLSGGEPLLRRDLADIVAEAHELGLYTNLITSSLGFSRPRCSASTPVEARCGASARLSSRKSMRKPALRRNASAFTQNV